MSLWRHSLGVLISCCLLSGCTGEIQTFLLEPPADGVNEGNLPDMENSGEFVDIGTRGDMGVMEPDSMMGPPAPSGPVKMPIRHITPLQHSNMIRALFGDSVASEALGVFNDADPDSAVSGYSTEPGANVATGRSVEQLFNAAEAIALASVDVMPQLLPCSASTVDDACLGELFDGYAQRAFRRPLVDSERALLSGAYDEAFADGFSEQESLAVVFQTMLQMPQFLYVTEVGVAREDAPDILDLTDHEIAQRLALFVLDSLPDDELRQAADEGRLHTPEQIEAQTRRLFAENPDASITRRLFKEWLHLDEVLEKNSTAFPSFDAELERAMREESERTFASVIQAGDTLDALLDVRRVPINQPLADFYGVQGFEPGVDGWAIVELPEVYHGLLARPYFLGSHASTTSSSHVQRGYTILKQFLCSPTGSIPADAMSRVPVYPQNSTSRQKSEVLRGEPACSGCHEMIDHIGLSLEHYDAQGQWRDSAPDSQGAQPLDVSGKIVTIGSVSTTDIAGRSFEGLDGLTELLVSSTSVEACIPRQWFRYALGRNEEDVADEQVILELTREFERSNGSLQELLISITRVEAFRTRALIR